MKKSKYFHIAAITATLAPIVYLAFNWISIPPEIPVRYDFDFRPSRFGSKSFIWLPALLISILGMLIYLGLSNLPALDKRLKGRPGNHFFSRLAFVICVFLSILNFLILLSISNRIWLLDRALVPLISLLLATIGNYFYSIKPNRYAGFRLPWTLSNEVNWRKTHRLGGPIWFWGGIATAVISLFLPFTYGITCFIIFFLISIILTLVYSYRLHKAEKNGIA